MTESSPVTLFMPLLTPPSKIQTVGVLLPSTEAKVINLTSGETMESHQSGELCIRGPQVTLLIFHLCIFSEEFYLSGNGWLLKQ